MFISWKIPYKLDDLGVIALFQKHIYMGEPCKWVKLDFVDMKVLGKLWERRYVDTLTFWVCNSSFKQSPPRYEPYQLGLFEHVGEQNMVDKKQLHE